MVHATSASRLPATSTAQSVQATTIDRDLDRVTSLTKPTEATDEKEVKKKFESILGELLYGEMLKSMRTSVGKAAYFNGGRAEQIFTQQLDQVLAQHMSEAGAEPLVAPMYDLFMLQRQ